MHFKISMIKSIIRILSCISCLVLVYIDIYVSIIILSSGLLVAEVLGILEEIKDGK